MDATAGHRRPDRIAFDAASNARQRSCASKSGFQRSTALPAIYPNSIFVISGGLMSYAPDRADQYRRAASYVDRIVALMSVDELLKLREDIGRAEGCA